VAKEAPTGSSGLGEPAGAPTEPPEPALLARVSEAEASTELAPEGAVAPGEVTSEREPSELDVEPQAPGQELNARLLGPLIQYLTDSYGKTAADRVARVGGLSPRDTQGGRYWISHEEFEAILRAGRSLMRSDEEFRLACQYRLAESYGPLRFLVRASSASSTLSHAVRTMHLVSRISRYEVLEAQHGRFRGRYFSQKKESRLMCLSRQAQIEAFTALWSLPRARVRETACISRGDPYCEYEATWYEHPRLRRAALGAGLGAVGAGLVALAGAGSPLLWIWLPVIGGLLGHMLELRAVYRRNVAYGEEANEIARDLARQNAEALQEVQALQLRHQDWSRLLEAQLTERQERAEQAVGRLQAILEERTFQARSLTHDIRTPLTVFKNAAFLLRNHLDDDQEALSVLADLDRSADVVHRLVEELMESTRNTGREMVSMHASRVPVPPLVDRIRRQMAALTLGKPVQVSVFATREAPPEIEIDPLVFDRILDNLLTNAARYTEQGHVAVELEGSPSFLTIKISDTGPGIASTEIERVFRPDETAQHVPHPDSFGVGLPTVVRLLYQIGGRLEVMSRPSMGTTFWVHLPVRAVPKEKEGLVEPTTGIDTMVNRVVTVRPAND